MAGEKVTTLVPSSANAILGVSGNSSVAVTVTLPATEGKSWVIGGYTAGYDATPTGGKVTITDDTVLLATHPITAAGLAPVSFRIPKRCTPGKAVAITIAHGGGSINRYLDVDAYLDGSI